MWEFGIFQKKTKYYLFIFIYIQYMCILMDWSTASLQQRREKKKLEFNWNTHAPYEQKCILYTYVCVCVLVVGCFVFLFYFSLFFLLCILRFCVVHTATCSDDRADFCAHLCISFSIKCCNATFFFVHSLSFSVNKTQQHILRAHIYTIKFMYLFVCTHSHISIISYHFISFTTLFKLAQNIGTLCIHTTSYYIYIFKIQSV